MKRAVVLLTLMAVVIGGAIFYVGRPRGETRVERSTRGAPGVFDGDGRVAGGAGRAQFNAAGTRLVVVSSEGVGIVEEGEVRLITPPQAAIADAGWLTGTTDVAVVQSPVADRIALINLDGTETGFVPLSPSLEVGSGHGLAVDTERRRAVIGIERRPSLEPLQLHLVMVDLKTGQSHDLTPPGGPDESGPFWLDDSRILFTRVDGADSKAVVLNLGDGTEKVVAVNAKAVGAIAGAPVFVSNGRVSADVGADPQILYTLKSGEAVVAVDPVGGRLALSESSPTGSRLRAQDVAQLERN
ncbi:MAG TPA: hypothetical protein VMY88_10990 [Acidimicrobiales bacterium]|nr:hypothetical protein [Acidimicrobiales bacterium]